MGTFLDKLYTFHQLTLQLYQLNQQIDNQRRRAHLQERKLQEHAQRIDDLKDQLRKAQSAAGSAELDLKTRDANLDKLRGQLNAAKTNKEYSALLREINTFKADTGKLEEQVLRRMAEVDELKSQLAALQQQTEQEKKRHDELLGQAKAREAELDVRVREVTGQRDAAAAGVPPELLNQINRVADAHDGEAMAPIIRSHPKREEYICGGCNMGVTLEQVNALQSRDEIQICNCCGRLLYLGESAQPSNR